MEGNCCQVKPAHKDGARARARRGVATMPIVINRDVYLNLGSMFCLQKWSWIHQARCVRCII